MGIDYITAPGFVCTNTTIVWSLFSNKKTFKSHSCYRLNIGKLIINEGEKRTKSFCNESHKIIFKTSIIKHQNNSRTIPPGTPCKDLFFIRMKFYSYSAKNQHNLSSQKVHLSCNKKSSKVSPENRRRPRAA